MEGSGAFGAASAASPLSYLAEPPSLSHVSDPNVVVSLRSVFKKDGTTRAKGLEELLRHVCAHPHDQGGGVDEALLDIWVRPPATFARCLALTLALALASPC